MTNLYLSICFVHKTSKSIRQTFIHSQMNSEIKKCYSNFCEFRFRLQCGFFFYLRFFFVRCHQFYNYPCLPYTERNSHTDATRMSVNALHILTMLLTNRTMTERIDKRRKRKSASKSEWATKQKKNEKKYDIQTKWKREFHTIFKGPCIVSNVLVVYKNNFKSRLHLRYSTSFTNGYSTHSHNYCCIQPVHFAYALSSIPTFYVRFSIRNKNEIWTINVHGVNILCV